MKKKLVAAMCAATMVFAMGTMALAEEEVKATGEEKNRSDYHGLY